MVIRLLRMRTHRRLVEHGELNDPRDARKLMLVRAKDEELVFLDGAARRSAELLERLQNLGAEGCQLAEFLVPELVESVPMPVVGPRLGDGVQHAAGGPAVFRRISAG